MNRGRENAYVIETIFIFDENVTRKIPWTLQQLGFLIRYMFTFYIIYMFL